MSYQTILYDVSERIATITLNRPDSLNAIIPELNGEVVQALERAKADDEVRVVILTGAGRGFCSGADLKHVEKRASGEYRLPGRRGYVTPFGPWTSVMQRLEKPVLGAVNGPAVGAGFSLALACDIRIASENARFGAVFVLRGVATDSGAGWLLPRLVGVSKACELVFTGDIVDAQEALRIGLVSKVTPHDKLMEETRTLAARIAKNGPIAVELSKRMLYAGLGIANIDAYLDLETYAARTTFASKDFQEGVQSFREKRPAQFKGE